MIAAANDNHQFADLTIDIHASNIEAGWWTNLRTGESLLATRNRPEMLMLGASELAEAYDGVEDDLYDDKLPHLQMYDVELADFTIRQFDQIGAEVSLGLKMPKFGKSQLPRKIIYRSRVEQLMFLVSIIAKAMEHYRKGRQQAYVDQMAVGIDHAFALAKLHGINLLDIIGQKRAYNKQRADHKPENRLAAGGKAF